MPNVFVVPVYVEIPGGFERAIDTLESHLRRAGYSFYTGEPLTETLAETQSSVHNDARRNWTGMAKSEQEYLFELWSRNICPYCGKGIPEGTRVGSGRKRDGGFCSLDHYTAYHQLELVEKAKKLAKLTDNE